MKKLYYFEGVRGIAAVVVLLSHFIQVFYPALLSMSPDLMHHELERGISQTPLNIFYNGNFAVCIFFVLSGFVLSYKYFVKKDKEILIESAVKRYFRLLIPVIISILFAYVLLKLNWFYYGDIVFDTRSTMTDFYASQHSFIQSITDGLYGVFFENRTSLNPVLWTMYYELLGSFLVFSFLALFGNVKHRYVFYIVLIIGFWNTYFIAFILGMLLCDANTSLITRIPRIFNNRISILILLLLGLFLGSYPYVNPTGTVYEFLVIPELKIDYFVMYHIIGAFILLVAMLGSEALQKILSIKLFRFLGSISFPLYLIHFIIICSFSSYIFLTLLKNGLTYNLSFIITFFSSLIVIFILSYWMYKYIDSKSVSFSKWIYERIFQNKAS